ncbi:MAG: exodeoxyribonuclease VII large subunit [Lachnospiraceae bacterium]|nr:exodeoxyribonuclease VII large subunit [Lachnospiraceae bacterium]
MAEIYSVSQINTYIKYMFNGNSLLNHVYVKGEISNCKYHTSGHIYFTLKDGAAQIACVLFAGRRAGISFRMEDGQNVIVFGSISVYERDGKYQLYADEIRLDGIGRLYEEFEYLKKKLGAEGLFAMEHKQKIPRFAKRVGIVTAVTGAALQDIRQISKRRNPYVQLVLYPAKVQGEGAADTVVKGIWALDGKVDVIIVGRGGGSIEDLWAFNEEKVARAIYECGTPVISAVGHETDTTIADYVSDLRAPTPSAAAELAVYDVQQLLETLADLHGDMANRMVLKLQEKRMLVKQKRLLLERVHPRYQLQQKRLRADELAEKLSMRMKDIVNRKRQKVALAAQKLKGLSPVERLEGGYAVVSLASGQVIKEISQVRPGDEIYADVTDGTITAVVQTTLKRNAENES